MAPSQAVADEATPSAIENTSALPHLKAQLQKQKSPKLKSAVDSKAYTTPVVNKLIEEEVQL